MLLAYEIPIIEPSDLAKIEAIKLKAIFARHVTTLVPDIYLIGKLKLVTLEGDQQLENNTVVCTGLSKIDPWQTSPAKLLEHYTVADITPDGWLYCNPKPSNIIFTHQVTKADIDAAPIKDHSVGERGKWFSVLAHRGVEIFDPTTQNKGHLQTREVGDYICQSKIDPTDVWIVKKELFESTYTIVQ